MNFLSIEYFAAVASEHSFSKAAKRLGITQQTLSANIAALGGSSDARFSYAMCRSN